MARYARIEDAAAYEAALRLCRGRYQRGVLAGTEALSGATLKGKARSYGAHYARSRTNLLRRLTAAGVPWYEDHVGTGRCRVLVLGAPPAPVGAAALTL